MNQLNSNTQRQKGKHLSFEERVIIQTRLNDKHSPNKIAAELGCSPNTIRNEIKRSTVYIYNGKVTRYKAEAGQKRKIAPTPAVVANISTSWNLLPILRTAFLSFVSPQPPSSRESIS